MSTTSSRASCARWTIRRRPTRTGIRLILIPGTSRAPYRIYNIGNQQPVELARYIEVIEACLGRKAEQNLLPLQPGDVPDTYADVQDLVDDVGYKPSTDIETGIRNFIDWYLDYYDIDLD